MKATLLLGEARTGKTLSRLLEDKTLQDFRFAVAYARSAGAKILGPSLRTFIDAGGAVQGIVGVNQGNTSYQGLTQLCEVIDDGLYLRCGRKGRAVFHPKLYFFGGEAWKIEPASVVVGSSNLTGGGLQSNEECDVLLEDFSSDDDFPRLVGEFWEELRVYNDRFATIRATPNILDELRECGALVDETQTTMKVAPPTAVIEKELSRLLGEAAAPRYSFFAMTLSDFDTSDKSYDPVVLIPVSARDADPKFWFWPDFFQREKVLKGFYLDSSVRIDGEIHPDPIRLYDYPNRSEFRLKSEVVKRNGKEGDILVVHRDGDNMRLFVVRRKEPEYAKYERCLDTRVKPGSSKKRFGYFNRQPS